jgi:hypothetical protein
MFARTCPRNIKSDALELTSFMSDVSADMSARERKG